MKKGFTLVELLAVIAVIAVLTVLLAPNIINNFKYAKENSFLNEVREVYSNAKNQYITDKAFNKYVTAYTKTGGYSCAEELDLKGRSEFDYYIEFDEDGKVIKLYATDGDYEYVYEGSDLQKSSIKETTEATESTVSSRVNLICAEIAPPTIADDTAMFDTGMNVNAKMKTLANGESKQVDYYDENIISIVKSITLKEGLGTDNIVSVSTSPNPIYMWYENGVIYWYTDARKAYMNNNSAQMFRGFLNLTDISSLSNIDTSYATSFYQLFLSDPSLSNISALSSWNTGNVTNMEGLFNIDDTHAATYKVGSIKSLIPLKYWNTSNVTNMKYIFQDQASLTSLAGLEYWNTSKVTDLTTAFCLSENTSFAGVKSSLTDVSALANWDVRKVEHLSGTFANNYYLKNLHGLENWKTDSLIDMKCTFSNDPSLEDISALRNWNVTKVTTMAGLFNMNDVLVTMFNTTGSIKSFEPLSSWNTSSLTNMRLAFQDQMEVSSLHGLENFNVSGVTNAEGVFGNGNAGKASGKRCKISDYSAINGWTYSDESIRDQVTKALYTCTKTRD